MRVILIGFMASGKTTIGHALSVLMGVEQYDLDRQIEHDIGLSVSEIFKMDGEYNFRSIERQTLTEVLQLNGILSTGGGTLLDNRNVSLIKKNRSPIVLLDFSDEVCIKRIRADSGRPLADKKDSQEILELKHNRQERYRSVADFVINTNMGDPIYIAKKIMKLIS